ncbi:hypothetical protein [Paracoccus haeundaensis]|uniref:TIGR04255 family protein n=1 Tax=Paracoccus haeundaensis TaxID=225362 RepID=A0A5C4R194_9RHOB|nr:hypothetical protein [Paracoccus haeundaensis]TNH37578.1 hypothetical protein FHD67_19580 [Paracoccus haeundaensis]
MIIAPEISGTSIVIVGNHNPAIFHPSWLFKHGVETEVDEELINIEVCHSELTRFSIGETFYHIDKDRFQISTVSAPWIQISDKVSMIFLEILTHTPGTAVGINRDIHFRVGSSRKRTEIGRILAPIEPWGHFGEEMNKEGGETGGMLSLSMRASEANDRYHIAKNIKIEPSVKIEGDDGIYMQANFHFSPIGEPSMADVIGVLNENFQNGINESERIFDYIMGM